MTRDQLKHHFYIAQGGRCAAPCDFRTQGLGKHLPIGDFQWDHIYPKSRGGPFIPSNLQLLCADCNKLKRDRSMLFLHNKQLKQARSAWVSKEICSTDFACSGRYRGVFLERIMADLGYSVKHQCAIRTV